jgi:hypothetical protein
VKTETPEEAKKTSEETIINEPTTKQESAVVVDAVKQEAVEPEKPFEDAITDEPTMKQESEKIEEKLSEETKINVPTTKQEPAVVFDAVKQEATEAETPFEDAITDEKTLKQESPKIEETAAVFVDAEEKPSLQDQTIVPAEETVKTETPEEAKKTSEETKKLSETAEVTVMKTEKPEAEKASEGTQEKLSETKPVEDVVASLPKEKVTEVVLTNADSVENKAVEATSKASE